MRYYGPAIKLAGVPWRRSWHLPAGGVTVQDYNCVQISVSGCNNHYESVLGAGVSRPDSYPELSGAKSV